MNHVRLTSAFVLAFAMVLAITVISYLRAKEDCTYRFMERGMPLADAKRACPW